MNPNPDRSAKGASLLAIGSAVAASACCIGPTVLLALGIGGLGFASFLEPYRPYLLGLTAIFLAGAFYMAYRPQKSEACAADGRCQTRSRRDLRIGVWSAAIVALLASAYPKIEAARAGAATHIPTADATSTECCAHRHGGASHSRFRIGIPCRRPPTLSTLAP